MLIPIRALIMKQREVLAGSGLPQHFAGLVSPTEFIVQRRSLELVEQFFSNSRLARAASSALAQYFDDPEADRALKKAFHCVYEDQLRALALHIDLENATNKGEVDSSNGLVAVSTTPLSHSSFIKRDIATCGVTINHANNIFNHLSILWSLWLAVLSEAVYFLASIVWIFVRHGTRKCEPVSCRVATSNFMPEHYWTPLRDAFESLGDWSDRHLMIVMDRTNNKETYLGQFQCIHPDQLKVPRIPWLRRVVFPGVKLFFVVLLISIASIGNARCLLLLLECFRQAVVSLEIWRLAFNLSCTYYIDNVEYAAGHYARAIIFRKFGGQMVRWPASQMDTQGCALSYLGYDLFLSGGNYQEREYGASWSPRIRLRSVGIIANDQRFLDAAQQSDSWLTERIDSHIRAGGKVVAFFPGSLVVGTPFEWKMPIIDILVELRRVLAKDPGWLLVIKPKGSHEALYDWMKAEPRLSDWLEEDSVVSIRSGVRGTGNFAAGWLLERVNLGVCDGGSIQAEGLVQGVPMIAYRPLWADTPFVRTLTQCGLCHTKPEELRMALLRYMHAPESCDVPYKQFRKWFDPFGDNQAMIRIARELSEKNQ